MAFAPVRLDGGGCGNVLAITPDKSTLVLGSDTQGYYTSTNKARTWTVQNTGIGKTAFYRQCSALLMSVTETSPQVVYSLAGEQGHGGGLLAGTIDSSGNISWSLRSGTPQGSGNHAAAPLPSDGWKRSTGKLLYQDSQFLYAGTYNQGVLRSSNSGGGGGGGGTAGLCGNTSTVNLYANTSTHALAATQADSVTGRTNSYSCQKIFFGVGANLPGTISDGQGTLLPLASAGCKFYLCVQPPNPGTPTQVTAFVNSLSNWISIWPLGSADALNKLVIVLFQEVQDKLTAAEYLAVSNNYVPSIHALGIKVAYVAAGHTRGTSGAAWQNFYPINAGVTPGSAQDNLCDIVAVDQYGATWISQGGTATFDPNAVMEQIADTHGKAFAITEMGSGVATSPVTITEANFKIYIQSVQAMMVARMNANPPKPNADCMWYNGDNNAAVINTLSGPNTTLASGSNGGIIKNIATWSSPSAGLLKVASTAGFGTNNRAGPLWIQCNDGTVARVNYNQNIQDATTFGPGCTYISGGGTNSAVSTGAFMAVWEFANGITTDFRIPLWQQFNDAITTPPSGGKPGADDFPVACNMAGNPPGTGNWFCRALYPDPNVSTTLWAGFYDSTGSPAGLWKCTNIHATQPNFVQITTAGGPNAVEDIVSLGDYLYCAAANQGIYRYGPLSGTPAWQNLNGATVPTGATTADWWSNVAGYVDGSSNHVLIIGNSNNTTASQCLMRLVIPSNYPTGSITYTNETASVNTATLPPGYTWWHHGGSFANWLGGHGFFCPFTLVNATSLPPDLYCTGSNGPNRNLAGAGWNMANSGCPMFLGHPVAANPVHVNHTLYGSSDWGFFDDQASNGTENQATLVNDPPTSGKQGFSAAISADGGTVYGGEGEKYTNAGGQVWTRPWNNPTGWTSMGLSPSGKVAIGLCAFNDNANPPNQIVLAAVRGSGMWRWDGTGWTNRSAAVLAADNSGLLMQIHNAGNGMFFAFDRGAGIFRSSDYGLSWTLIWSKTSNDSLSGNVAYDRTRTGRLWVSTGGKLFKLGNADTGTVSGGSITGSGAAVVCPGSGTAGPMGTDGAGNIFLCSQDTGSGSALWVSGDDGATWTDVTGGDGSFAQCNCNPEAMSVGPFEPGPGAPRIYVSGSNVVASGYPSSGGAPPGISAPFTELQVSSNTTASGGQLLVWFNQAGGVASTRGTMLSARLELTDGSATVTPVDPNWQLAVDSPAAAGTGTARVQIWHYFNNPGGIAGPGLLNVATPPEARLRASGRGTGSGTGYVSAPGVTTGGAPIPRPSGQSQAPQVIAGQVVPANPVIFNCSNTSATFKGKLFEYFTPIGTVQALDQTGTGGTQGASNSLLVTATAANTFTGGLAVVDFAANWSPAGSGQSWTTPAGWTSDGTVNNLALTFATYYQNNITAGPTSVTGTINPGSGGTMIAGASAVATYYATAASQVSITTTDVPDATAGVAYPSTPIVVTGGAPPYAWAITNNQLPDGMLLDPNTGILSGTPGTPGTFPFTVTATDSASQTASASYSITVSAALSITTASLPNGQTGVSYAQQLTATGGTSPYTWAIIAGQLPTGLTLTAQDSNSPGGGGVIGGIPVEQGAFSFTVRVSDRLGFTATANLSITITAGALVIQTVNLPPGTLGQPYSAQFVATGGGGTYTWALASGSLPLGLSLSSSGAITGTLRSAGHYAFSVTVTG